MNSKKQFSLSEYVTPIFTTPKSHSHWFGYYNYSPFDAENRFLLSHRVSFDGRAITSKDYATVGFFDLSDGSWNILGKTRAFNWQQGAMLQWLGPNFNNKILYNDVEEDHFVARIVDRNGHLIKTIHWPIYSVTPDGKTSISLQFERSYWCRAYHYEAIRNPTFDVRVAKDDGIFSVDLNTGQILKIIDINSILEIEKIDAFNSEKHWFEHIMLNPEGNRFAFYHRYSENKGHRTRAFTSDLTGNDLFLLPGWKNGTFSHLGWRNNDEFVIFGSKRIAGGKAYDKITKQNFLGKIIKRNYRRFIVPFMPQAIRRSVAEKTNYQLYRDRHGVIGEYSTGLLRYDGHPSFTPDGRFMLTDTYADGDGYRHLLLFNTYNNKLLELGRFFSPYNLCGHRCDLHPRFSQDANMVIIDSAHLGKRQMMVLHLDWKSIEDLSG